ncbi:hypothetical protein ACFV1N_38035, partial [Streptosporangium canum]|uniref:hypothetical protein n=1 Tax=Streptosporangium canum TaxID=324952 RepID=UPI0036A37749
MRVWDPTTGTQLTELTGHTGEVRSIVAFTRADGRPLLATSDDGATVRVWDPTTGTQLTELTGHTGEVNALVAFSGAD